MGYKGKEHFCERQEDGYYIVYDHSFGMWLRQCVTV